MISRIATKLAIFALKCASLSIKDRNVLTAQIMDNLSAFPLRSVIEADSNGNITIGGKTLNYEQLLTLRESAKGAQQNQALKVIFEQITYLAIASGLHKATKDEDLLFSKAAIWWKQQIDYYLELLGGNSNLD